MGSTELFEVGFNLRDRGRGKRHIDEPHHGSNYILESPVDLQSFNDYWENPAAVDAWLLACAEWDPEISELKGLTY